MARFSKTMKKKLSTTKKTSVTTQFKTLVKEFMDEHSDVLKELAKK